MYSAEMIEEMDAHFEMHMAHEYEQKPYTVRCDIPDCDVSGIGSEKQLRAAGWYLGRHEEICPNHGEI
jgi:hypothetical protein